jgi:hypothetical protein
LKRRKKQNRSIKKLTPKQIQPSQRQPRSGPIPRHRRWFQAAKLAILFLVGLAGLAAAIDDLWGPIWPTELTVDPGAPELYSPFAVPFTIKNRSVLFTAFDAEFSCEITEVRGTNGPRFIGLTVTAGVKQNISPNNENPYKCAWPFNLPTPIAFAKIDVRSKYEWRLFGLPFHAKLVSEPFTWDTSLHPPRWVKGEFLR